MEMELFLYGKEIELLREMLKERNEQFLSNYSWLERPFNKGKKSGSRFVLLSDDAIFFYFLGQEFERRRLKYILENHAFSIPDDDD